MLLAAQRLHSRGRFYIPAIAIDSHDECADHVVAALTFNRKPKVAARNEGWSCATLR